MGILTNYGSNKTAWLRQCPENVLLVGLSPDEEVGVRTVTESSHRFHIAGTAAKKTE